MFPEHDRSQASDRQRKVCSDLPVEQAFERLIQNPRAAEDRRQQRQSEPADRAIRRPTRDADILQEPEQHIRSKQAADQQRQQVDRCRAVMKTLAGILG